MKKKKQNRIRIKRSILWKKKIQLVRSIYGGLPHWLYVYCLLSRIHLITGNSILFFCSLCDSYMLWIIVYIAEQLNQWFVSFVHPFSTTKTLSIRRVYARFFFVFALPIIRRALETDQIGIFIVSVRTQLTHTYS